jgi:hypothetical protein
MSRGTPAGPNLVKDLQGQLKKVTTDLRERSEQSDDQWAQQLRAEYDAARDRGRTALTWTEWRDGEIDLAAVAWILATVFIRFCEDNQLIDGPWITGQGPRHAQAADNETAFYKQDPARNSRDWLRAGFQALADLPAGRDLLDPRYNLVWRAPISADAASGLLTFWRTQDAEGNLIHDFTDPDLDTRFLGDLYQDLSDHAKKKYALLQTPVFVEEFILDRTLTPAVEEFGLDGLKLIDPTCGSGHFLLGAFQRLLRQWQAAAPAMDTRQRVQKALDSIHGVDLNPFAVAIARFRLTVAALQASGLKSLKDAPAFDYHLVVGDSLLFGHSGTQEDLLASDDDFTYASEDISSEPHILDRGRYHVVVGNPPYITVKDKALNEAYRRAYSTCHRQYALSVPFMELFFELAVKGSGSPAGYIGQITSNSFMKREFGSKVIEDLLSGTGSLALSNPVDLQFVIDTSGAYIPGHGTPTVILIGRRRRPIGDSLRAVLGVRGEPGQPKDPAEGLVWTEITRHLDQSGFDGAYVTVTDMVRTSLAHHPWSLSGGGASDLMEQLQLSATQRLSDVWLECGFGAITGEDEAFALPGHVTARLQAVSRPYARGEDLRDFSYSPDLQVLWPYEGGSGAWTPHATAGATRALWLLRTNLLERKRFGVPVKRLSTVAWFEYREPYFERLDASLLLAFAAVATHNHFVLDRGGKVFKQSAPVIRFPSEVREDEYLGVLGVLNSSSSCFWLKQVCHGKGNGGVNEGMRGEGWEEFYDFTGTKLEEFPLPGILPVDRARRLEALSGLAAGSLPSEILKADVAREALDGAREVWHGRREQLIFEQEELDWEVYRAYGLIDEDLTYSGGPIQQIRLGERAFEIALARKVAEGSEETAWFERHGSTPISELPESWPADYRALVERRLELIASDPAIGLLERPEYKRRWQSATFDDLLPDALRDLILDKVEAAALWSDPSGPGVLSVAQLADRLRGDTDLVEAVRLLRNAVDVELTAELGALLADEAVPFLAAHRYKDSGLRKREEWERVWDLQRREDAGEQVSIPVPPKYGSGDFRKTSYWKARGKLDVPKERFIAYPGASRSGDPTMVVGWAGWDHLEQARALARLIVERSTNDDLSPDAHLSLVAGLVELEPWLHQWHGNPDSAFGGTSPAAFMTGFIDNQLATLGKTRADAKAWRP